MVPTGVFVQRVQNVVLGHERGKGRRGVTPFCLYLPNETAKPTVSRRCNTASTSPDIILYQRPYGSHGGECVCGLAVSIVAQGNQILVHDSKRSVIEVQLNDPG